MTLSNADLQKVADQLFMLKHLAPTKLVAPANSPSLTTNLGPIVAADKFKNLGIAVVNFTADPANPTTFLINGDRAWRVGSTGKIAILLAAMQLRDDVRQVQALKLISTAKDYDDLFALPKLWSKSKFADARRLGDPANAPRISTIFDVTKTPAEFIGPDADSPQKADIFIRVQAGGSTHLKWELALDFDFTERLWLCGALSDNVAATSLLSEIGVDYVKAVQRAYGLYDDAHKRGLLLAGPYANMKDNTPVNNDVPAPTFRPLQHIEYSNVSDGMFNPATHAFDDHRSFEGGTAAALIAYAIALMKDELVDPDHEDTRGISGCKTLRTNLSTGDSSHGETRCVLAEAIVAAGGTVAKQISKIGLLGKPDGEPGPLDCEFSYVEVTGGPKFAMVVTGTNVPTTQDLGKAVFNAVK